MDKTKTAAFYDWQIEKGVVSQYGERTDHRCIARLVRSHWNGGAILDLGCCTGAVAQALTAQGIQWDSYVGLDLSEAAIARFHDRRLPEAHPRVADATNLAEYRDGEFALVIVAFLLQDLTRQVGLDLLRSIPRVIGSDGALLLALTVAPEQSREMGSNYRPKKLESEGIPGKYTYLWARRDLEEMAVASGLAKLSDESCRNGDLLEVYSLWARAAAQ